MAVDINTKQKELELWKTWKKNPSNATLKPLMKSLNPFIENQVSKLHGNLPRSALKGQMTQLIINALPDYDPSKAQLNTYLGNTAGMKLHRYVYTYQNMGQITEPRILLIKKYKNTRTNMENELGRPPTYNEIADEMKVPVSQLKLLDSELRQDLIQDGNFTNIFADENTEVDDAIVLLAAELQGQEKEVVEYLYGLNGKPKLQNNEIADKLHISPSMIVVIKNKLANRLRTSGALRGY